MSILFFFLSCFIDRHALRLSHRHLLAPVGDWLRHRKQQKCIWRRGLGRATSYSDWNVCFWRTRSVSESISLMIWPWDRLCLFPPTHPSHWMAWVHLSSNPGLSTTNQIRVYNNFFTGRGRFCGDNKFWNHSLYPSGGPLPSQNFFAACIFESHNGTSTEVCRSVVHRRGQIGSGSQVFNYVRLPGSKATCSGSHCCHVNFHLPIALDNQPANLVS